MSFIDANCDNDYSYGVQPLLVNNRLECNPEPRDRKGKDFYSVSSRQSTPVLNTTELEHAKLLANTSREALARFPAGRAMLEAKNHGNSAEDPRYLFEIAAFYDAQRLRLRYEALERFYKHLGGMNSRSRRSARILAQKRQNADDWAASTPSPHNTTNSSKKENHSAPVAGASINTASGMMRTRGSAVQTSSNEYATPTSNMLRPEEPARNRKGDTGVCKFLFRFLALRLETIIAETIIAETKSNY
ncbi:MAG: hypothetical protein M1813_009176 [Trichoglossum hirsutum]|nr:MAG: hypothetical protein M1813_009176 [Trichoglossum hirsutum]